MRNAWDGEPTGIVGLGSSPGVALQGMLRVFPTAKIWCVGISPIMIAQSRRRNRRMIEAGRLALIRGDGAARVSLGGCVVCKSPCRSLMYDKLVIANIKWCKTNKRCA